MSADQFDFSEYETLDPSRDELVDDLQQSAGKVDGVVTVAKIGEVSDFDVGCFRDEFGSLQAALVAAEVVQIDRDGSFPEWINARVGSQSATLQTRQVASGRLEIPDWAEGFDELVVRSSTTSRKTMHAPDLTADEPLPRCEIGKRRTEQMFVAQERENVEGFYSKCGCDVCQDFFAAGGAL